ncbi:hypothetical protein HMP0721_1365 [Pseudoramibacter alactolyticus ATCC 23263]|uniref:Uncharacterized protein n=1 Tax=Pseudoramibacter alactolyticus ATCC 23263 TaxID=887929 RepID=E6MH80_9FIRM|nr:hypothetical protein HMP0721_1365 [Pseudoramibacter alactolyticus ATCC 23263]
MFYDNPFQWKCQGGCPKLRCKIEHCRIRNGGGKKERPQRLKKIAMASDLR